MSVLASFRIVQCFHCLFAECQDSLRIVLRDLEGASAHLTVVIAVLGLSQLRIGKCHFLGRG